MKSQKQGSLGRAGSMVISQFGSKSSIFTLEHWSTNNNLSRPSIVGVRAQRRKFHQTQTYNRAQLILLKCQESALNLLLRWSFMGGENEDRKSDNKSPNNDINLTYSADSRKHNGKKRNRSSLLLYKVAELSDRNWRNIVKFIFYRWLTCVNVVELILIIILLVGCIYQCYEPITEYYKYPTYVSVKKIMNDNFKNDLPSFTLCNKNKVSKQALKKNFPDYNISHFLAITLDTFYSLDDWSLPVLEDFSEIASINDEKLVEISSLSSINSDLPLNNSRLLSINNGNITSAPIEQPPRQTIYPAKASIRQPNQMKLDETNINWVKVTKFLTENIAHRTFDILPNYNIIENMVCANIWGDHIACDKLAKIVSIQEGAYCVTLFHGATLYDPNSPGVEELDLELRDQKTDAIKYADDLVGDDSGLEILDLNDQDSLSWHHHQQKSSSTSASSNDATEFDGVSSFGLAESGGGKNGLNGLNGNNNNNAEGNEELRERFSMGTREVIRIKVNFTAIDYKDVSQEIGGIFSVHSNSHIGAINHIKHFLEPGFWYNHYIERYDYERLPAPYDTNCYNYTQFRHIIIEKKREFMANLDYIINITDKQAREPHRLLPEYADSIRQRAAGSYECRNMCKDEMSVAKCKCWSLARPYVRGNYIGVNVSFPWCDLRELLAERGEVSGDDLHSQLCLRDYSDLCMTACPGECDHSTFDISQQARAWPSFESMRYTSDKALLARLKQESECCSTISVIYANPATNLHLTEPKYTIQDIVIIVTGNLEAWIGLSAVRTYLFLEQLYDALIEAELISPISMTLQRLRLTLFPVSRPDSIATNAVPPTITSQLQEESLSPLTIINNHEESSSSRSPNDNNNDNNNNVNGRTYILTLVISIFTKLKVKITLLFAYFIRLLWFKNKQTSGNHHHHHQQQQGKEPPMRI